MTIEELRRRLAIYRTQVLAESCKVNPKTIRGIVNGTKTDIKLSTLEKLVGFLEGNQEVKKAPRDGGV